MFLNTATNLDVDLNCNNDKINNFCRNWFTELTFLELLSYNTVPQNLCFIGDIYEYQPILIQKSVSVIKWFKTLNRLSTLHWVSHI